MKLKVRGRAKRHIAARRAKPHVPADNKIVLRAPELPRNPYELKEEHVTLIKNTIAKGATHLELQLFLATAKRHRLDPFTHQIWLVPRWDRNADSGKKDKDGQPILGAFVRTTQIGIDGFLHIAARDHRDFGSISRPEYGPIISGHPEWAVVKVYKKGITEPTIAEAWWEEYAPTDLSKAPFWRKMPRRMLSKCAAALAIRQAYPETFSGIYIPEECEKVAEDYTPEGRRIVEGQPTALAPGEQAYLDREQDQLKRLTPEQREVVERKMGQASRVKHETPAKEAGAPIEASQTSRETAPALFYALQRSGTYEITGSDSLKSANKDLLAPLWNGAARAIVATPDQLGKLISQFEKRKVPFRDLTPMREPGE